jgi:hypothetical protein
VTFKERTGEMMSNRDETDVTLEREMRLKSFKVSCRRDFVGTSMLSYMKRVDQRGYM